MLGEVLAHPQKLLSFARKMRVARGLYGRPYGHILPLFFELLLRQNYTPREIFYQGLLDFESAEEALRSTISKSALIALQQRLNPASAAVMTEDKALFYRYCRACGLPAPRLLAVIGPELGWTAEGTVLRRDAQWADFLDGLPVSEIVIKPSLGVYGRGIQFLQREAGGWRDQAGQGLASADVVYSLRNGGAFDSFVIQERTRNHPDLTRLSGTDYLQTLRINTAVSAEKGAEVLGGRLKVIGGGAATDNFDYGRSGNMVAYVGLTTGRIERTVISRPNGVGLRDVERHPATGIAMPGFEIPFWHEACELTRRAAIQFLPLLCVGWDVAVTPHGPLLIEGNAWWDPTTERTAIRAFRAYARDVLDQPMTGQPPVVGEGGGAGSTNRAARA